MQLVIQTQICENYGAHDWDGRGQCPQYWKNKGGSDYAVKNVPTDVDALRKIVSRALTQIEESSDYFTEHMIDWSIEADDWEPEMVQFYKENNLGKYPNHFIEVDF